MPDRYEFLRKIAQGGFGHVYVAKDTRLGREVAIKRLLSPEESAAFDLAQSTFEREATTLAAMQHPNIVQVFDFDHDDEGTFVVMEKLEGETLKDRLNRGPLTWDTFVNVTRQALDAINAAHSKDILHRDLKPENLFLHRTPSGTRVLKILDFGLAKLSNVPSRQTMDQSGNVFGSIYYMAPEQFMRRPLDGRTDLYALGCVFYQALTARFAFHGDNMQGTMEAHMEHQVRPIHDRRPDLAAPICDWLMRLISFRPEDRPADAMTALREFEAALEGKTLPPPPKTVAATPARPAAPPRPMVASPQPARMAAAAPAARYSGSPTARPGNPASARPGNPSTSRPSGPAPQVGVVKAPMQTRPMGALEASRADAKARLEAVARRKRLALMIGAPIAGIALLAYVILRPASKGTSTAPAVAPATASNAKAAPTPKPAPPPPLPEPEALALPMEAALTWRLRAGADSRHKGTDGKFVTGRLLRGQSVQFWRNLPSADKAAGLIPYEDKNERSPTGQMTDPKSPDTSYTCLNFPSNAGMEMKLKDAEVAQAPGNPSSDPMGVTIAAVFRANIASKITMMHPLLLSDRDAKHRFGLLFSHRVGQYGVMAESDGQSARSMVTPEEFARRQSGAGGTWVAVVAAWNAKQGTVQLRVRSPSGNTAAGPESPIPAGMPPLDRLNLGFSSGLMGEKEPKEKFDGDIIEIVIYRQALDAATQEKLLATLWDHYLKKKA